jgi:hypothetical protein
MTAAYLDQLHAAAGATERAETEFRRYVERRLETMTAERVRAHRRYHLVSDMVESARPIAEKPACVAAQIACALAQAGWSEGDPAYDEVCERLGAVAALVHNDLHGEPGMHPPSSGVLPALAAFESWYCERFGTEFPALLSPAPGAFRPIVDF